MAIVFDANGNLVDTENNINFFNRGEEQVFPNQDISTYMPETNTSSYSPDLPYDTLRFVDNNSLSLQPNYLMPNTNKVPQLPANRLEGLPTLDLQSLPANMGVANEADVEQVDSLTGEKKSNGIMELIKFLIPGNNLSQFLPKSSPETINMRNFYSPQGLTSTGSIASGIMKGYNPVSGGFLNMITRGKYGKPTNYGLANAARKRIERIANRKIAQTDISRARIKELQEFARADTTNRARFNNPSVYASADKQGFTDSSGGFKSAGTNENFSNKTGRGRTGY